MSSAIPLLPLPLPLPPGSATTVAADGGSVAPCGGERPSFRGQGAPGRIVARHAAGVTGRVGLRLRAAVPELSAPAGEHVAVRGDRITYALVSRGTTAHVPWLVVRADGPLGRVADRDPRTLPVELRPDRHLHLAEPWPDRPAGAGSSAAAPCGSLVVVRRLGRRDGERAQPPRVGADPRADVELTGAMT